MIKLEIFEYEFRTGPFDSPEDFKVKISKGNCRLAVQLYFFRTHNLFLKPEQVLNPYAFRNTGKFVFQNESVDFRRTRNSDVIYAEKLPVRRSAFKTEEEWLISLHTAVVIKRCGIRVWHASSLCGKSELWTVAQFEKSYKIVAVKRILGI